MAVENTLHDKHQIHLGPPASLHGGRGGNDEEREGEKLRNAVLWLGVGSQSGMAGQTRHSPSPSDPPSESVAVLASEQVSPPPLPSHTIEQALCLIGVSWWLPRGRSRGGGGGGGVLGIRHRCLTCVSGLREKGPKIRQPSESLMKSRGAQKQWGRRRGRREGSGQPEASFSVSHTHPVPLNSRLGG